MGVSSTLLIGRHGFECETLPVFQTHVNTHSCPVVSTTHTHIPHINTYESACSERLQLCLAITVFQVCCMFVKRDTYLIWTDSSNRRRALRKPDGLGRFKSEWLFSFKGVPARSADHTRILLIPSWLRSEKASDPVKILSIPSFSELHLDFDPYTIAIGFESTGAYTKAKRFRRVYLG